MGLLRFLLCSRGVSNLFIRVRSLVERFGFSPKKMESALNNGVELVRRHKARFCLPLTAIVLARHPEQIRKLQARWVELAVHGFVHTDYTKLPFKEQLAHFGRAVEIFKREGIKFSGFRAPYTKWNADTIRAVKELGFSWDSSKTVIYELNELNPAYRPSGAGRELKKWSAYKKVLNLYAPVPANVAPVLPEVADGVVEIPVTLPDDEMLVDRLGLSAEKIKEIWLKILTLTYAHGELFTLQIHPERFMLLGNVIESVLKSSVWTGNYAPKAWVASLDEIAEWWVERSSFTANIQDLGDKNYKIVFNCSPRATILWLGKPSSSTNARPASGGALQNSLLEPWYNSTYRVGVQNFEPLQIRSEMRPVIGVGADCSQGFVDFLKVEGYIVERTADCGLRTAIYFDHVKEFNRRKLLEQIEASNAPLIRFWRWPYGARSCLSITGDIDALTLFDFLMRIFGR